MISVIYKGLEMAKQSAYHISSTTIPAWMLEAAEATRRRPAPSMLYPGALPIWRETWGGMVAALNSLAGEAMEVTQAIAAARKPWSADLIMRVRETSTEPAVPPGSVYAVATGRGLLFLVAVRGINPETWRDGLMRVHPWGRPDLVGWTTFRGEADLLDPSYARQWIWAAWRCQRLLVLMDVATDHYTIPGCLGVLAAEPK